MSALLPIHSKMTVWRTSFSRLHFGSGELVRRPTVQLRSLLLDCLGGGGFFVFLGTGKYVGREVVSLTSRGPSFPAAASHMFFTSCNGKGSEVRSSAGLGSGQGCAPRKAMTVCARGHFQRLLSGLSPHFAATTHPTEDHYQLSSLWKQDWVGSGTSSTDLGWIEDFCSASLSESFWRSSPHAQSYTSLS